MKIFEWLEIASRNLRGADLQLHDPAQQSKQILAAALQKEIADIYFLWENELSHDELKKAEKMLSRRMAGEPFQYIVGYEWFWKDKFSVGKGVLIPRRETEHLVEWAVKTLPTQGIKIAELGAGSGNIGLSYLRECPENEWFAYELNPDSLPYLKDNVSRLGSGLKYHWAYGDFFEMAKQAAHFDAIVANPPYVSSIEGETLSKEVKQEPPLALFAGADGLDVIRRLSHETLELLRPGGYLALEIGATQGESSQEILSADGWGELNCLADYSGRPRVIVGRRN